MIDLTLEGAEELEKKLRRLPIKAAKKVYNRALRKGARIVEQRAKANVVSMVGGNLGQVIADALIIRAQRKRRLGEFGINSMIDPKKIDAFVAYTKFTRVEKGIHRGEGKRYFLPAVIEYGHAAPFKGGGPKSVPAKPFYRAAFDASKQLVLKNILRSIREGIEREAKKA